MQMDKGQAQRVIETVWPWQATKPGGPRPEAGLPAVARGGIQAVIMGIIGFLLYRYLGHERMAYVVWSLALGVLASAVFLPPVFAAIEGFGRKLGLWVGTGLTYLLLVPFFYLVFVPGRAILWARSKDPMQRTFPTPEKTCWVPRKSRMDDRHYRKQFS
jgi:hypothetical protein